MATTDRGIYYTTSANDSDVADFNVISKAIADSTEAALDVLDADIPTITVGSYTGTPDVNGKLTIPLPAAPVGKVWYLFAHVINYRQHLHLEGVRHPRTPDILHRPHLRRDRRAVNHPDPTRPGRTR